MAGGQVRAGKGKSVIRVRSRAYLDAFNPALLHLFSRISRSAWTPFSTRTTFLCNTSDFAPNTVAGAHRWRATRVDSPERLRPRIQGRSRTDERRVPRFRSALLSRMFKAVSRPPIKSRGVRSGQSAGRAVDPNARRCVVKAGYVVMNAHGQDAARLHLRYLERDGVERDGATGRLYGEDAAFDAVGFAAPIGGERHQFRFIVSPEDGPRVDLSAYARGLMAQVERDLMRPLLWAAVNHHNTDNPHVHIVVRGVDRLGKHLRITQRTSRTGCARPRSDL